MALLRVCYGIESQPASTMFDEKEVDKLTHGFAAHGADVHPATVEYDEVS
jgi:hypothetical protein